jgi:hypothetical protein
MQITESNITINVKDLNRSVLLSVSLGLQIKHHSTTQPDKARLFYKNIPGLKLLSE